MLRQLGKALAAVALVEVEAGLVAAGDVQAQAPVVLADLKLGRACLLYTSDAADE